VRVSVHSITVLLKQQVYSWFVFVWFSLTAVY